MQKYDLQMHTVYSRSPNFTFIQDAFITFDDLAASVKREDLVGIAITDHNTVAGALKFSAYAKSINLPAVVIIGEEIRTLDGDVIGLQLQERIPPYRSIEETLDLIRENGGMAVAAHPYAKVGVGEKIIRRCRFDALETQNANYGEGVNSRARKLAEELSILQVGGSDAHEAKYIGNAYTQIPDGVSLTDAVKRAETNAILKQRTPHINYAVKMFNQLKYLPNRPVI